VDTDNKKIVSKEEMVEIVTGFLLSSPPGEYLDVVRGMKFYFTHVINPIYIQTHMHFCEIMPF